MLSILLHMHQPDYRDPRTRAPSMPWVRLHATRGYRDVPVWARETGARVTVNLVPSLIDQWEHYARGGTDPWLVLARRPADTLEAHEREWLLERFFAGHEGIFHWFAPFGELRARRRAGAVFDDTEVRDVIVWSNLAWFGWSAIRDYPVLAELRRKGRGFTEAEKDAVLDLQHACVQQLAGLYRGLPEVSATPYYHPILPLLVNTAHARRCLPEVPDPGFAFPEDARAQLVRGKARVEAWAGRAVEGLWPSEGSVSPEVAELAADAGFRWLATDQHVLERSERGGGDHRGAWQLGRMRALFRDHALSDRIGFLYAGWRGEEAAADLVRRAGNAPVMLALDGENPWEAYPDAGEAFLHALARAPLRTCGEMARDTPVGSVRRVHTGSWINADFSIWIGHAEDRAAWVLLAEARRAWEAKGRPAAAADHLYAAQGSDWFWWYGEEFSTPFSGEFDRLFRAHLAAAWEAMGEPVPDALARPLKKPGADALAPPRAPLGPDGEDWFAWAGAGRLDLRAGAMAPMRDMPRALLFGERGGRLQLRLLPDGDGWHVHAAGRVVPFADGRADAGEADAVVLVGPRGQRVPGEGVLVLPWRYRVQHLPE
ncbi:MAG: glycoside hydrolase [Myxococcota bacterium]